MTDQELADKVVALGVGSKGAADKIGHYGCFDEKDWAWNGPYRFVRDWRVAGALLERCQLASITVDIDAFHAVPFVSVSSMTGKCDNSVDITESLPRAIIEPCCEALQRARDE